MILFSYKKIEIMPFAATWMDLVIIILSEVRERQISYVIIHMWNLIFFNEVYLNELIYNTETGSQTLKTNMVTKGEMWGGGIN